MIQLKCIIKSEEYYLTFNRTARQPHYYWGTLYVHKPLIFSFKIKDEKIVGFTPYETPQFIIEGIVKAITQIEIENVKTLIAKKAIMHEIPD